MIEEFNTVIIANDNKVANPNFNEKTNRWTLTGDLVAMVTNDGLRLSGIGTMYQILSRDIEDNTNQMAMVYIHSITGLTTLKIGTTVGSSDLGSLVLIEGWNTVNFTAGSVNILTLDVASGTTDVVEVNVKESKDLIVSGNIRVGNTSSGFPIGNSWRLRPENETLYFEYSTDNFATVSWTNAMVAE